jgi:hypothetical protein
MNNDLLLPIALTLVFGYFLIEGFVKGRICVSSFEFDRVRQPYSFWFVALFYTLMPSSIWMAYLDERGLF